MEGLPNARAVFRFSIRGTRKDSNNKVLKGLYVASVLRIKTTVPKFSFIRRIQEVPNCAPSTEQSKKASKNGTKKR